MHTIASSRTRFLTKTLTVSAIVAAVTQASLTYAQPMLEEIVVTATKREEGLQDIPVSVGVMSGEKMIEQGAFSLEDIALFIPNVDITETSGNEKIFIRGIGTYGNAGFEQSVGTFVDGIYRGRGQASRAALLDLARVEVLKGPQNTIFGKNTIAGALNITSNNPTDEFEASVLATYEPEFDGWGTQLVVSGPLSDTFRARLAVRYDDSEGWFDNRTIGQDERQEEELVGRLTLDWDVTDNLNFNLKYETGQQDTVGRQNKVGFATPTATFIYQTFGDPNFQDGLNYNKYQDGALPGRSQQFDDSEWDLISLTGTWEIGDFTLRSITGWIDAEVDNSLDLDFAPIQLIGQQRAELHEQFTQEFILFSPQGETLEYLAGVFYQDEDLTRLGDLDIYLSGIAPLFATNPLFPFVQAGLGDTTAQQRFVQDSETLSFFGQVKWNVTDRLNMQLGLRYSEDEKELFKSIDGAAFTAENYVKYQRTPSIAHTGFYDQFLGFYKQHQFDGNGFEVCDTFLVPTPSQSCNIVPGFDNVRSEDHLTGDFIVQYDLNDDMMLYAKYGQGYKAGGFDAANTVGNPAAEEFEDETAESWEFGAKLGLWDGRATMNIVLFQSQFEDLQVSVFDGVAGFEVANAGEATSEGIEIDGQVAVTEELTVYYAFAYLDSVYDSFPGAACHVGLQAVTPPPCVADLSGQNTQFAPEYSGNLSFNYVANLTDNLDLDLSLDLFHR